MLLVLLVTLSLACGALASECCSAEDRHEVQRQWHTLWSAAYSGKRVAVGKAVFADLFEHHEGARELFSRVNSAEIDSPEFSAHCIRVINGLDVAINLLDDPATLDEQLHHLNQQHHGEDRAGIHAEHFEFINNSFKRVLPHVIPCFNPDAWNRCFHRITHAISEGLP